MHFELRRVRHHVLIGDGLRKSQIRDALPLGGHDAVGQQRQIHCLCSHDRQIGEGRVHVLCSSLHRQQGRVRNFLHNRYLLCRLMLALPPVALLPGKVLRRAKIQSQAGNPD